MTNEALDATTLGFGRERLRAALGRLGIPVPSRALRGGQLSDA
jgi:hypothetical protein